MDNNDFQRFNRAAKSIEADACEAYHTVKNRFGADVAGALVVLYLRLKFNPEEQWPAPDGVEGQVEEVLKNQGILTG